MAKIQLPWPRLGKSDDINFSEQPPQTSKDLKNVRLIDARTGRSRGGQRAGLRTFFTQNGQTQSLGTRIEHLASISFNSPKIEYSFGATPTVDTSIPLTDEALAIETDRTGNKYALLVDGRVQVWNEDSVELDTISPPLDVQETVVPSFAVDEARRVFVAASKPNADGEGSVSRLFMFRFIVDPDDDELVYYDTAWELEIPGQIKVVIAEGGAAWVAVDFIAGEETCRIAKVGGITTNAPFLEWNISGPYPVTGMALSALGEVYITSPSNPARGTIPDTEGLHVALMSFTPDDLGYVGVTTEDPIFSGKFRLHAWVSGDSVVPGTNSGEDIPLLIDRRYVNTQNTAPAGGQTPGSASNPSEYGQGSTDTVLRNLFKNGQKPTPRFRKDAFAGTGGLFFNPTLGEDFLGSVLRSSLNLNQNFKQDTSPTEDLGFDTDQTDETLGPDFETFPTFQNELDPAAIDITTGSMQIEVTFAFSQKAGNANPKDIILRAVRDPGGTNGGTTVGPEVRFQPTQLPGTVIVTMTLPSTLPSATSIDPLIYIIDWRSDALAAFEVTIEGLTTRLTVATLQHNEHRPDKEGTFPASYSLLPGNYAFNKFGDNWTNISTWKIESSNKMRMLAFQNGGVHKWALIGNAKVEGGILNNAPGFVTFLSNTMVGGESQQFQVPGVGGDTFSTYRAVSGDSRVNPLNTAGYAIITIQSSGVTGSDPATGTNQSFFRVNGTPAGFFSFEDTSCFGDNSRVVFGSKTVGLIPNTDTDLFGPEVPFEPFWGILGDFQTVLGSTSDDANANGDPSTYPTETTSATIPPGQGQGSGTTAQGSFDTDPPTAPTAYTIKATEVERLEGALAHARGMGNYLPNGFPANDTDPDSGLFLNHPFGGAGFPPSGFANPVPITQTDQILLSPNPLVAKIGANGSGFVWAFAGSGVGGGVTALPGRFIATAGEFLESDKGDDQSDQTDTTVSPNIVARKIFDGGNTYSTGTLDGAWTAEAVTAAYQTADTVALRSDTEGNVYLPFFPLEAITFLDGETGVTDWAYFPQTEEAGNVRSIALSNDIPVYPPDYVETDRVPIFLYAVGQNPVLEKLRQVVETQVIGDSASPRTTRYLLVAARDISEGASGGTAQIVGKNVFSENKTYISSAQLISKLYFTDGLNYVEYDPITNFATPMKAATRGEMPKRARLMIAWDSRLVFARPQDDDSTLFASAQHEPLDWDYDPANPTQQSAWNITLLQVAGGISDTITALMPMDNILIIGCDHSIYKLVGNPRAGGRVSLVSDETGMAFGRSWTKDPSGIIYFFGQRGGVYAITRGLEDLVNVERISEFRIERQLQEVDLSTNRVEMVWDYKNEGLHVIPIPYVSEVTA